MPSTLISTRKGWIEDPRAVIEAVQSALVEAWKIPDWNRFVRLSEFEAECYLVPPERGPRYTLVEVSATIGRSVAAKKALYAAVVRNLAALGVPSEDTMIAIIELPAENWGVRGGIPASEFELDYLKI